jgi:hypothetical protein
LGSLKADAFASVVSATSLAGLGCFASTLALYLLEHSSARGACVRAACTMEQATRCVERAAVRDVSCAELRNLFFVIER